MAHVAASGAPPTTSSTPFASNAAAQPQPMYAPQQLEQLLHNELQFLEAVDTTERRLLEAELERRVQQTRHEAFTATQMLRAQQLAREQHMAQPLPAMQIPLQIPNASAAPAAAAPIASLAKGEPHKAAAAATTSKGRGADARDKHEAIAESDSDATLRDGTRRLFSCRVDE